MAFSAEEYVGAIDEMDLEEVKDACEHRGVRVAEARGELDVMKSILRQNFLVEHVGGTVVEEAGAEAKRKAAEKVRAKRAEDVAAKKAEAEKKAVVEAAAEDLQTVGKLKDRLGEKAAGAKEARKLGIGAGMVGASGAARWLAHARAKALAQQLMVEVSRVSASSIVASYLHACCVSCAGVLTSSVLSTVSRASINGCSRMVLVVFRITPA